MSILTKEEREEIRECMGIAPHLSDGMGETLAGLLDTIDAMEAELLHAEALLENTRRDLAELQKEEAFFKMAEGEKQKNVSLESKGL